MPVLFIGHGSPTNALETNVATETWRYLAETLPRPKAVLCISAHWYTRGTAVTAMAKPRTIHDFGPLAPELFTIQYPAPGDPALATRVQSLLAPTLVTLDSSWGLDHGTWSVMVKAYPNADMPVVQLSMDMTLSPAQHLALAQRLKPLRDEGILIIGSGNIVHNLSIMNWDKASPPYDWALRFNQRIKDAILRDDPQSVCDYTAAGRDAELAVPSPDHYWPLLYSLGARDAGDKVTFLTDFIQFRSLGMTSAYFGAQPLAV